MTTSLGAGRGTGVLRTLSTEGGPNLSIAAAFISAGTEAGRLFVDDFLADMSGVEKEIVASNAFCVAKVMPLGIGRARWKALFVTS